MDSLKFRYDDLNHIGHDFLLYVHQKQHTIVQIALLIV